MAVSRVRGARSPPFDVLIVGAGPAGLTAALMLGRARRRVLVLDEGHARNRFTHASHGFFTRDGAEPEELRKLGEAQLRPYGVRVKRERVTDARRLNESFEVVGEHGRTYEGRHLLLATGIRDAMPEIPGFAQIWGKGVLHCPWCDGWEVRDRRLAVYGRGADAVEFSIGLTTWSEDVLLFTNGAARFSPDARARLAAHRIGLVFDRIERLESTAGELRAVVLTNGTSIARDALFYHPDFAQASDLPARLGCRFTRHGTVKVDDHESAGVPGLFVAGDASRDLQFIAVAVAEGTKAAVAIHRSLREEETRALLARRERPRPDAGPSLNPHTP